MNATSPAVMTPRGRLAPSPTGRLHVGNAFAFLAAWLSARQQGGAVVLRMEDIDPDRSRAEYAQGIIQDLSWLGLDWDEGPDKGGQAGPYEQSLRGKVYAALLDGLRRRGLIYPCYCSRKDLRLLASAPHVGDEGVPYPGTCRGLDEADRAALEAAGRRGSLRLDTAAALRRTGSAEDRVDFCDGVLGPQSYALADCGGDFALRRSDGVTAYQLAVAADDAAMRISEVLRGQDLLPSTPRQVLLFQIMGALPPRYAHLPLVHDEHGQRLAKRHRALSLAALREAGVDPRAVCGWLAWRAGWTDRAERAGPHELIERFTLAGLQGRDLRLPPDAVETLRAL